jgi:H+/gluconate symporter-like permease
MILLGAALSIPMAIAAGLVYGPWIARRMYIPVPAMAAEAPAGRATSPPAIPLVLLILLLPVILIFAATISSMAGLPGRATLGFLGHPFTALAATALVAAYFFGARRGLNRGQIGKLATESLAPMGALLCIMGGGGAFKQVILDSGVGTYAGNLLASTAISPLLVAFVVAAALRVAQGSATVAIITAAGIVAPLVKTMPGYHPEMVVLALCCGGTSCAHVNDAGFWIVNQYYGMTVPQTFKTWTVMKVIASLLGLGILLAIHPFVR